MFRTLILCSLVGSALMLNGCVIQPVNAPGSGLVSAPGDPASANREVLASDSDVGAYRLNPLDPLFLRFSGIAEQQQLELVIDENGEISLLHIAEPIKAAGLTTSELAQKIERLYVDGGIYRNVSVNVTMTAKVYYMQGEINQPGQFQLMSGTTLLQAIAGSRGYTAFANKKKVTITRHGKIYTYNATALEKDPSKDVKIEAGDVVKIWQQWY
ncbi:MAG: polysaccharide biosynthesis/export family protein [Kiritimatiellales bacterium]|nr:polysaccharide biosynthesis/export family protein [Kiritimatiellales bacterium]MCF7863199.1 polysaccharide biosynthesis/export family protein [Kiritimatiellales bacterium]